ncbi:acyl carrier protein [Sphingobacterium luzhongxinii]|uniref:acyl carrier protein n=1 Tax=Sphingobacterium luzhongxinii TaxID=2654181 RepID=UPI0013D9A15E|nr:acyl carrier protein [Sphingobacterium sp. xlx-73]
MTKQEFATKLTEELELSTDLTLDTDLKKLEEWDSMTAMILIGIVSNEFDIDLSADDIQEITTVNSLIEKIGAEKF